ncbi:hypothetical protein [uncultured Marinobacter sp.]|uniref:hypothetical protein n=1 Tax=uncultured Marinobacter sp. TaxID=187379 RepID=UPI00259AE390|nr:hypothetical protein [uncultured Marinobacter sp.]
MAGPITWRNVSGGSNNLAGSLLTGAEGSFNSAFDSLRKSLDGYTEGVTDRNTQKFTEMLGQYRTPEELQAAREAGEIQNFRQGLGRLVDANAINPAAVDQRLATLRDQANQQYEYDQTQLTRQEQPLVGEASARIAALPNNLDPAQRQATQQELTQYISGLGVQDATKAKLLGTLNDRLSGITDNYRDGVRFTREGTEFERGGELHDVRMTEADQRQTEFDQTQKARSDTASVESKVRELITNSNGVVEARNRFNEWVQSGEAEGISPQAISQAVAGLPQAWASSRDLLPQQLTRVETFEEQQAKELQRAREDYPINEEFAFTDGQQMSEGDAFDYARELGVDDFDLLQDTNEIVASIKKDADIQDDLSVLVDDGSLPPGSSPPWGNIMKVAFQKSAEDEVLFGDKDIVKENLDKEMRKAFKEWVKSTRNKRVVRELEDNAASELSKFTDTLRAENTFRQNLKGQ